MSAEPTKPTTLDPGVEADLLVCPHCGYDLRGATADECSECGQVSDPATLRTSGFPWAHRKERGRVRAYLLTVWLVTIGSRRITHEAARPQREADERSFRRVTATLLAFGALGPFVVAVAGFDGLHFLAIQWQDVQQLRPGDRWLQDLLVPWSAGATLPPVIPLMLIAFAFALTSAHRRLFRLNVNDASPERQQRADAIAGYAAAPLFWLFPAAIWGTFMMTLAIRDLHDPMLGWIVLWFLLAIGFLGSLVRVTQWSMRVRYAGFERFLIDGPQIIALWLWTAVLFFVILPWCVGLVWIIIDSFL